jgi:hypothetical protein
MWLGELTLDALILSQDTALCCTFVALLKQLRSRRSSAGLSFQTLVLFVGARCLHLGSHVIGLHYLPEVLPWFPYLFLDVAGALLGVACLLVFVRCYYSSYEAEKDSFGIGLLERLDCLPKSGPLRHRPVFASLLIYSATLMGALLWYFVRQSQAGFALGYYCCLYEAMSAVALVPQLWMFNQDRRVPAPLATFVVLVAVSRLCTLGFWTAYPTVHPWRVPANRSVQIGSEIVNLLILSDFMYYWLRSTLRGDKDVVLPL